LRDVLDLINIDEYMPKAEGVSSDVNVSIPHLYGKRIKRVFASLNSKLLEQATV
jgi:hypothetical protein